ncbi:serine/threonine-protein kinase, partial [Gulosibacter sp. 10]|uniref:serine/threonine-protein kinase n=1 Tax=Gulosibacter sp. 10 TaxID=1255570 RepID=UPI0015954E85
MGELIAGRVELLDPLGRGAAGAVWRAVDRRRGGICAAKVMRQRDSADIIRFLREQSAGARHRGGIGAHRHLLTPYAWVADEDDVVLLMPLARGGTLAEALGDHGALAPALVAELLRQLLDGLAAVHAAGWVHRDVTPANLMLEATGTARPHLRLADFGIALRLGEPRMTALGHVPGTPGFIAPEILRGGPVSTAQDVWAAGAVALTALDPLLELTGTAADERARPAGEALDRLLPERGEPRADALREALLRMLDADPEARPGAAEAREALPAPAGPAGDWALTAEGEVFEVFDQIESWSDESSGPEPARPAGAPVSAPVSSSALAPNPASAPNPVPAQKPAPAPRRSPAGRRPPTAALP